MKGRKKKKTDHETPQCIGRKYTGQARKYKKEERIRQNKEKKEKKRDYEIHENKKKSTEKM